ncbi:tetratricopeptide repeat protein [Streptomyces tanashiensis]|uniref:tetratricopeptide repeat protein n=1 Tax=Streptomyces tanashiensis TaxID=67367 RepID=UPI00167D7353|nr:tetratricopeptide repeat protein [Streptomyces tanashiensis]
MFHPGGTGTAGGTVVWSGTPQERDDAALVLVDDSPHWDPPTTPVRWGRLATDRPGADCETWGVPDEAQRARRAVEATQLTGEVNPGTGFVSNQYVMDLRQYPLPQYPEGTSPWGGLSGASMLCGRLLTGVVAADRAHSGHSRLNVVPAYVLHHDPAFRAALAEHGAGTSVGLEAAEFQNLADRNHDPASRPKPATPASLLEAGRQIVPFHGRDDLIKELRAWCRWGGFGAWLLHGPGGQGKTRLAHHLAGLLAIDGWTVLWPRASATADQLLDIRHATKPLLVVLDYAETRTAQLTALIEAVADHPGSSALKLLLLARTDGDWWRDASTSDRLAEDYLSTARTQHLSPLEDDPAQRPHHYRAAFHALAAALPLVEGLGGHDWSTVTAPALPLRYLEQDAQGNALTLHMTALADLLDAAAPLAPATADGSEPAEGNVVRAEADAVEDRLLGHESRYWRNAATVRGLVPALSTPTLEAALAAAHLAGADDREQADRLWRRLPALADQPRDRRDQVTSWIAALYPPTEGPGGSPWGSLQPDRLAERHTGRALMANPALGDRLLDGADEAQAAQLITVYSRAAAHAVFGVRLGGQLTDLCVRRHQQLAPHIIDTATRTAHPGPLIAALEAVTADPTTPFATLFDLEKQFPASSYRLARTAVQLARNLTSRRRALAEADSNAFLPSLASSLNNLAADLNEVGQREESLAASLESVSHYRVLAQADPGAHRLGLAISLSTLSGRLSEMGRRPDGLATGQEAVSHLRLLAETDPDAHLPFLVKSLINLSALLAEEEERHDALAVCEEAVGHCRVLARRNPHLPDLAKALGNLAIQLRELGRREAALTAVSEAVSRYRVLAGANADACLPDLASSLRTLGRGLHEMGQWEEALTVNFEALGHYRLLAEVNAEAYLPRVASSLNDLSLDLGALGRWEEGLAASRRSTAIRRAFAEADPDAYLLGFAVSLTNLATRLSEAGLREEALACDQEATSHYRALADVDPHVNLPFLAKSLSNLGIRLGDLGRQQEALAASEEAVSLDRLLAEAKPDSHRRHLAISLNNLGIRLSAVGRLQDALAASHEAVSLGRLLTETSPDVFRPDLANLLYHLSLCLAAMHRREESMAANLEAVSHYLALAQANPLAFQPGLAKSLHNLAIRLGELGRHEDALATSREAVTLYRALADGNPTVHLPDLVRSLRNLAMHLSEAGCQEEALNVSLESTGHQRRLATADPDTHLPDLATSLSNLAVLLAKAGRLEDALTVSREAVAHCRTLAQTDPAAYLPDLVRFLYNLFMDLQELGLREEALAVCQEGTGHCRALVEADPDAYLPLLAQSLHGLAIHLGTLGQREEGVTVGQEAVAHYRALAAAAPALFSTPLERALEALTWLEGLTTP